MPDQMLENILNLEERIGDAETSEPLIQAQVLEKKLHFYQHNSGIVREKLEKG